MVVDVQEGRSAVEEERVLTLDGRTLPVRLHPVDVDPLVPSEVVGPRRIDGAMEPARERRLHGLLIRVGDGWRVEGTFEPLSSSSIRGGAAALRRALGAPVGSPRLADPTTLDRIRAAFVGGDLRSWQDLVRDARQSVPADPAVQTHGALAAALGPEQDVDALRLAAGLNPDGASELQSLAHLCAQAGRHTLASELLRLLIEIDPSRVDQVVPYGLVLEEAAGAKLALQGIQRLRSGARRGGGGGRWPAADALAGADVDLLCARYESSLGRPEPGALRAAKAVAIYRAHGRVVELSDARHEEGVALVAAGHPRLALDALAESLTLRQEERSPRPAPLARAAEDLARATGLAGQRGDGREPWSRAAELWVLAGDEDAAWIVRIDALPALADAGSSTDDEAYAEGLRVALAAEGRGARWFAELDYALGEARQRAGDHERSNSAYDAARALYEGLGDRLSVGQCLYASAVPLLAMGRVGEARARLDRALGIAVEIEDVESVLIIREQLDAIGRAGL